MSIWADLCFVNTEHKVESHKSNPELREHAANALSSEPFTTNAGDEADDEGNNARILRENFFKKYKTRNLLEIERLTSNKEWMFSWLLFDLREWESTETLK